jgi:hypothetical protein
MTWVTQQLLDAVAQASPDDCITEDRMAELTGLTARQVENSALKLRQHGWMERVGPGCHRLTRAGRVAHEEGRRLTSGPKGPEHGYRQRDHGLRQRAWNVLRMGKKVTLDDVLLLVVEGSERDPKNNVGKYFRALAKVGYLHRQPIRERGMSACSNGAIRWLLVRDTGPIAPTYRLRHDQVYDPNTEQVHDLGAMTTVDRRARHG